MTERSIDRRPIPNVKGVDLEHALNYIDVKDVSAKFIYGQYTGARLPYVRGGRPVLESVCERIVSKAGDELGKLAAIASYVAGELRWQGYSFLARHPPPCARPNRTVTKNSNVVPLPRRRQ